ncbi:MAG: methyltransferase domain-containing protein [Streptosporangiaceae bacterium]
MTHQAPVADAGLRAVLAEALTSSLTARAALRSPRWVRAFRTVPRDVFTPRIFIDPGHTGSYELLDGTQPGRWREWLEQVYSDEPLVTQLDGGTWLSSSSQPSLMAMMLEALAVTGTERVLEIGTGTGYNAALLCAGLGSERVTSIDIDAGLVETACTRLHQLGYRPALAAADGACGLPGEAPYDRIMATCSMPQIPAAWISQSAPGGLIMVNLYRELGGGALALLGVSGEEASGHFLPFAGGFMPTRTCPPSHALDLLEAHQDEVGERASATVPASMLDHDAFGMLAALRLPGVQRLGLLPEDGPGQTWLLGRDGSWARQDAGEATVVQGGPERLWDHLEQIHHDWVALGSPARQEFGLTVTVDGHHRLWHRSAAGPGWGLQPGSRTTGHA